MRSLSDFLRATVLGLFLGSLFFHNAAANARRIQNVEQMTMDEIVNYFSRSWQENQLTLQIFDQAEKEPEFRKELIEALVKRFADETVDIRARNLTRVFVSLNAREVLPQLRKKWNETEKKLQFGVTENSQLRIHLLIAIAKFLPEDESIEFLIKTESDTTEDPLTRFRATILLCAAGNKKAIEHVLAVYEKAKKEFPATMHEGNPLLRKIAADTDGDWISDYIENGLLLDPNNPDTDGDGLIDGNDRNPLCKLQEAKLAEDQEIAQFILYLHARYYRTLWSPFQFKLLIVEITDDFDGMARPGLFSNLTCTGIDGIVLHLSREQILKLRTIHEPVVTIRLHKFPDEQKDTKKFSLIEFNSHFNMTFKNYNGTWLPADWERSGGSY